MQKEDAKTYYLVAVAGGHGTRMHSDVPKQFLELGEKPILRLTMEKFLDAWPGIRIVTVLPADNIERWKSYCMTKGFVAPQTIVEGGITRFHSVRNAVAKIPDGAIVAIHDGVRPLLSVGMIREIFSLMSSSRAVIPVTPSTDTLKMLRKGEDGELHEVEGRRLDRSEVWKAQTPQIFRSEDLRMMYAQPYDTSFTDDASVAQKAGIPLSWYVGERLNIKITTPEDLAVAKAMMGYKSL